MIVDSNLIQNMTTLKNLYSFNAGLLKQTSSNATEMKFFEIKHLLTELHFSCIGTCLLQ